MLLVCLLFVAVTHPYTAFYIFVLSTILFTSYITLFYIIICMAMVEAQIYYVFQAYIYMVEHS